MIHVVIDTMFYRRAPRLDTPEFRALEVLSENGCIQMHLPYVIQNEMLSELRARQREEIDKAANALKKVLKYERQGPRTKGLKKSLTYLDGNRDKLVLEREQDFLKWHSGVGAIRHALLHKESKGALDSYFSGAPPFKEVKNRAHIPDAFIYQCLLGLQSTYGLDLVFVSEDGNLRESAKSASIRCVSDLKEFLAIPEIVDCLATATITENYDEIIGHISQQVGESSADIRDAIHEKLLADEYRLIRGDEVPGENREIYVSGVGDVSNVDMDDIEYFGGSLFSIEFTADVEFNYEYPMYKADVFELLERRKVGITDLNDHYYEIEDTGIFSFCGRLDIEYDVDLSQLDNLGVLLNALANPRYLVEDLDYFSLVEEG